MRIHVLSDCIAILGWGSQQTQLNSVPGDSMHLPLPAVQTGVCALQSIVWCPISPWYARSPLPVIIRSPFPASTVLLFSGCISFRLLLLKCLYTESRSQFSSVDFGPGSSMLPGFDGTFLLWESLQRQCTDGFAPRSPPFSWSPSADASRECPSQSV